MCPNCKSTNPAEVIIERHYDGTYDPEQCCTTIDYSTCTTDVMVFCPDCGEDYPHTSIANPQ